MQIYEHKVSIWGIIHYIIICIPGALHSVSDLHDEYL